MSWYLFLALINFIVAFTAYFKSYDLNWFGYFIISLFAASSCFLSAFFIDIYIRSLVP